MLLPLNASDLRNGSPQIDSGEWTVLRWAGLLTLIVILPTIGGNILVILAVSLEKKLQYATNYFLMSLAVADLLVGLLVMPIALLTLLFENPWPLPPNLCPAWLFLDVLFSTASIMHLCAISLDRYVAIKKPIQASQYNSRATTLIKIAVVWLISIGIAMPIPIRGLEDNGANLQNFTCVLKPSRFGDFILYGSIAAFFVPLAIMVASYCLTIRVLHQKAVLVSKPPPRLSWNAISTVFQRETAPGSSPDKMAMLDGPRKDRALPNGNGEMPIRRMSTVGKKSVQSLTNEQRASKVLGIVFFLFLVMWCPFFITNITSVLCQSCSEEFIQKLMEIFVWIGYISSGVNPLVYTLFNKTFREAFGRYIVCNYRTSAVGGVASRKPSARLSFRSSVTENSKLFVMHHGRRNGINPVGYPNHRLCGSPIQSSSAVLLDTLLLTEHEGDKTEEQASYV